MWTLSKEVRKCGFKSSRHVYAEKQAFITGRPFQSSEGLVNPVVLKIDSETLKKIKGVADV